MARYARFYINPLAITAIALLMFLGGVWIWLPAGLYATGIALFDKFFPYDLDEDPYAHPWVLDVGLYLSAPTAVLWYFAILWTAGSGSHDALGAGAFIAERTGIDVIAARNATGWYHYALMCVTMLVPAAAAAGIAGHELTHRTARPLDLWLGRLSMAIFWGIAFPIEHVYGHHSYVGTPKDPATAARGDSLYRHLPKSMYRTVVNAWEIESDRLAKIGAPFLSPKNALLRAGLVSVSFSALAYYLAGPLGLFFHLVMSVNAKVALEALNYVQHYGLVRVSSDPVQPRHSWNCNHMVSGVFTLNLTRHSHHHADAQIYFQDLATFSEQPEMPGGLMTAYLASYFPWVWRKKIAPKLLVWDREQADAREYALIREANAKSGWPELAASVASQAA